MDKNKLIDKLNTIEFFKDYLKSFLVLKTTKKDKLLNLQRILKLFQFWLKVLLDKLIK